MSKESGRRGNFLWHIGLVKEGYEIHVIDTSWSDGGRSGESGEGGLLSHETRERGRKWVSRWDLTGCDLLAMKIFITNNLFLLLIILLKILFMMKNIFVANSFRQKKNSLKKFSHKKKFICDEKLCIVNYVISNEKIFSSLIITEKNFYFFKKFATKINISHVMQFNSLVGGSSIESLYTYIYIYIYSQIRIRK